MTIESRTRYIDTMPDDYGLTSSCRVETGFWWKTTGEPFARMLAKSAYPASVQSAYMAMFYLIVCPEFGTSPYLASPSIGSPFTMGASGQGTDRSPLHQHFPSYMTDDHSPIELSCIYGRGRSPQIRFAIDPITCPRVFQQLADTLSLVDADLTWCLICAEELAVPNAARIPKHPSRYFVGFDLGPQSLHLKAYFMTEARASSLGVPKLELVAAVVRRLSSIPHDPLPNLMIAWGTLHKFLTSLPAHLAPSVDIVAVDCVPSRENRLKVYVRTSRASFSNLRHHMTLGGTQETRTTSSALKMASAFWKLLFSNLPDGDEPDVAQERLRHPTSGLLFYFELRGDSTIPLPKVYIPVRHLCPDDECIVRAVEMTYAMIGLEDAKQQYGNFVRGSFTHRPLSVHAGIHTYVAFAAKPDKAEITTYFSPECFGPEREAEAVPSVRLINWSQCRFD
ncbi:tryptophan dimethylallyltransferase-domain-containing protein [Fomitopsis serialis]|uniref:tryptophan dimethylallyltransferase-domain-containing protein n=1 Tax=Fomitopsis serialis TaxID=139415 RepID=UPI0020084642|nr:tryptophan dimethylallyltransferase-domain-containing protein [Neoantrodia serialis]KAH9918661.1 tryptophan dimethylallyltransferase-domain-containing protein [Neoantrodia serialis]